MLDKVFTNNQVTIAGEVEVIGGGVFGDNRGALATAVQFDVLHRGTHLNVNVLLDGFPAASHAAVRHGCFAVGLREYILSCPLSHFKAVCVHFRNGYIPYASIRLWRFLTLAGGFLCGSYVHRASIEVNLAPF